MMFSRRATTILLAAAMLFISSASMAQAKPATQDTYYPWAVTGYVARMSNTILLKTLRFYWPMRNIWLYSLEGSYQLAPSNPVRRFFSPVVSTVDVVMNVTRQTDPRGALTEYNPYVDFRWTHFPWNHYVATTMAFGEGVSYATKIPEVERDRAKRAEDSRKFLNFIIFEVTAALPKHPQWQLLLRWHHRSGVFGLYCPGTVGSTAVGVGLRYSFKC